MSKVNGINFDKVIDSNNEKESKVRVILQANLKDYIVTKYYLNKFIKNIEESSGFISVIYTLNDEIKFNSYQIDNKRIDSTASFSATINIRFFINSDFSISIKYSIDTIKYKARDTRLNLTNVNWVDYSNSLFPIYTYYDAPSLIIDNFKDNMFNNIYNLKFTEAGKVIKSNKKFSKGK